MLQLLAGSKAAEEADYRKFVADDAVAIEPGREQPGLALLVGLVHGKRRFDEHLIPVVADNARQADQVAIGVDVVFVGLAQCANPVFEHRAAVAKH